MDVEIITIGDELLIGQVTDTNSVWMANRLNEIGLRVSRKTAVGDVEEDIKDAVHTALERISVVLLTGGIGPTKDDITKKTLCDLFGSELYFSEEVFEDIERITSRMKRTVNKLTRDQAMVPNNCTVIRNEAGTAPGIWFERDGKVLVSMPGVPYEMKWIMEHEILPRLKEKFQQDTYIKHYTIWVAGYAESDLALKLARFEATLPAFVTLAYLPQPGIIRLRLSVYADSERQAGHTIDKLKEELSSILGDAIVSTGESAPELQLGKVLGEQGLLMGTAESCTGGRIASIITAWPGSSKHYAGTIVSYNNDVKKNLLGVSEESLRENGAVSRQVVEQMVKGAMKALNCNCAVATSGIAGPDGGTPEKPVGTVWIAAGVRDRIISECYHFSTIREQNIIRSANTALLMLLKLLEDNH